MKLGNSIRGWMRGNANGSAALAEPDLADRGLDTPLWSPRPIPIAPPRPAAEQAKIDQSAQGLSGTANLAGFIYDVGEYNRDLQGLQALKVYEQMRRSDPTVQAVESAIRLPIRKSQWTIEAGVDASQPGRALAKEIAAMVEENLFGGLESPTLSGVAHSQTFESVLENALLCASMGVAGHEDLWEIDRDKNRVRLRRMAPRLPLTFYQFLVEADGETLRQVVQFGYRGAIVEIVPVDANKMTLFILNREGANFYGRSVFRGAYQPWFFKSQLMRIDAIGAERNRLAIPIIEQGPNASPDDKKKSWTWVENLSTNERTGLSLPNGWKFILQGIQGRAIDLTNSMRFYDEQIADAALAGFLSLGKTASGSRALGDVKTDFFLLSEQALARMIADTMNSTTVRRLVDFNYKSKRGAALPYPKLICSDIVMADVGEVADAISKLASANVGMLETSEERDNFIAQRLGIPPINGTIRAKYAPIVRRIQQVETTDVDTEEIPDQGAPKAKAAKQPAPGAAKPLNSKSQIADLKTRSAEFNEVAKPPRTWTPRSEFEKSFDQAAHREREDKTSAQVARLLRRAKPRLIADAARQASQTPMENLSSIAVPFDYQLATAIETILQRAEDFGGDQIYRERQKQTGRKRGDPVLAAEKGVPRVGTNGGKLKNRVLNAKLIAQATVTDLDNWINARTTGAAVDLSKDGLDGDDLEDGVSDALLDAPDGAIDRTAAEAGRSAVFSGRGAAMDALASEIVRIVRREVMDANTCAPCKAGDGRQWSSYADVNWNRGDDCEGGDACRGDAVAEFQTGIMAA